MLILTGCAALSEFRHHKLLKTAQSKVPVINQISAKYVHLVATKTPLAATEEQQLRQLLQYGNTHSSSQANNPHTGQQLWVTPRPGTVSPWSSKATDIAHNCGLKNIVRIERGIAYHIHSDAPLPTDWQTHLYPLLHDRMMEAVLTDIEAASALFQQTEPAPLREVDISEDAQQALQTANQDWGLALSADEVDYLAAHYSSIARNPTDAELMMFAQANSEHCRHKIFNADWVIDGQAQDKSLFAMIRNTHEHHPEGVLSAYADNAAVMQGATTSTRFIPQGDHREYRYVEEPLHILMKVETHNHPTAISPYPGAATGSGGEIRDEGATGNGSKPKAGLCGFSVSNLKIPGFKQPWEQDYGKPARIASALDIMLEGPIGAAAFNNEFGRPNISGYFRTLEMQTTTENPHADTLLRGYHKPIMIAGGVGSIRENNIAKQPLPAGTPIVVLGGPALLIGLGGSAASSMTSGSRSAQLDFASVQRENPEMQRRCQEVIDRCVALAEDNPVLSIHDVGAGGLSNAIPEIIHDAGRGGRFELREVLNDEPGMSPMEIWCNEAQERYVLAIAAEQLDVFTQLCERERALYAVVGYVTEEEQLQVNDQYLKQNVVNLPMNVLLGKPPKLSRDVQRKNATYPPLDLGKATLADAIQRVLRLPAVASKNFLITIADRTVSGLVSRDQMVGPWQVPVADVAVTLSDYQGYQGEAMSMGERTPLAMVNPAASGRMAIGEALTNIAAAPIKDTAAIKLSANWMAAAGYPGEDAALFDTVKAVGEALCPRLGIAIPVGKDSLSMRTVWEQDTHTREMVAPVSLIISAFAAVQDVRGTLTPQLRTDKGETALVLVDLGQGKNRLAASALAQVYEQVGQETPDVDNPDALKGFFNTIQSLRAADLLLAYHDRSDGGLLVSVLEMAFAGHTGVTVQLENLPLDTRDAGNLLAALFTEELGAILQIPATAIQTVLAAFQAAELGEHTHIIGTLNNRDEFLLQAGDQILYQQTCGDLHKTWAETSYRMQALRDNPDCALQEFQTLDDRHDPGLPVKLSFKPEASLQAPFLNSGTRPKVAILREQGVNGQLEMAAAFDRAGFQAIDVHMTDIISGQVNFADFQGIVTCGGFSYGDVLGAGGGWAKTVLFNEQARTTFSQFFERTDVFGLGVCNGCQMLSQLKTLIPGAAHWPQFHHNTSGQYEARLAAVEVLESPSLFLQGMVGSVLPIAVAHGEGRAVFSEDPQTLLNDQLISLRYVDNWQKPATTYPANPNGSPHGITGLTTQDGRFTIMMPHPERLFRSVQHSWHPDNWQEAGPWLHMFQNARYWLG